MIPLRKAEDREQAIWRLRCAVDDLRKTCRTPAEHAQADALENQIKQMEQQQ